METQTKYSEYFIRDNASFTNGLMRMFYSPDGSGKYGSSAIINVDKTKNEETPHRGARRIALETIGSAAKNLYSAVRGIVQRRAR